MSAAGKVDGGKAAGTPGGKKKLIVVAGVLVLLAGGAAGWFSGVVPRMLGRGGDAVAGAEHGPAEAAHGPAHGSAHGEKAEKGAEKKAEHPVVPVHGEKEAKGGKGDSLFMDLPDIVANLNTGQRRAAFVKLRAKLELTKPEDQGVVQAAMPRVLDLFQGYLREMRPEELRGTAGTYRLREELLARTNLAAPPARVVAVLFTEMIVQ